MSNQVYCRYPDIHDGDVVFVADDDVWRVSAEGGRAQRLTADHASVANPRFSPDGSKIAWTSFVNGEPDAYVLDGGAVRRLTWFGSTCLVVGWADDDHVVVASGHQEVFAGLRRLYRVGLDGSVSRMALGPAMGVAWGPNGELAVNTPNNRDSAFWKHYRGGTASALWLNQDNQAREGWVEVLPDEPAGKYSPGWLGDRLIFTCDRDGVGQLYSVAADGSDMCCHTAHTAASGYVRDARTDGTRVVFHAHGVIYVMDGLDAQPRALGVDLGVNAPAPEDVEPVKLGSVSVDAAGAGSLVEWHGGAYFVTHRAGPARGLAVDDAARVRLPAVLGATGQGVAVTDSQGADALEIMPLDGVGEHRLLAGGELGRVLELVASPDGTKVALASHDGRVIVVGMGDGAVNVVGRSEQGEASDLAWSPDSRYLVWRLEVGSTGSPRAQLQCTTVADGITRALTSGTFDDFSPAFTLDGKYLAWLSRRNYDPSESAHSFALTFNAGDRVLVSPLSASDPLPFGLSPDGWALAEADGKGDEKPSKKKGASVANVAIDADGLEARAVVLPVPAGDYRSLLAVKDGLTWLSAPDRGGELGSTWQGAGTSPASAVQRYSFNSRKCECLDDKADGIAVSGDGSFIAVTRKDELTVIPADRKLDDDDDARVRVDLGRLRRRVDRRAQWRQMFDENGRLMADHFWREDMNGVDWSGVLATYRPLIDTAMVPSDVYDILYECVAELGTSHAYIIPDDEDPALPTGYLGAEFQNVEDGFEIVSVLAGDSSDPRAWPPLRAAGVAAQAGDVITAVDGRLAAGVRAIGELLEGAADKPTELTLRRGDVTRRVVVTPCKSEAALRYHDWVAARAAHVEQASNGRLGYIHVPDMDAVGWAQLERRLGEASAREGLLADMRYNRGGYTSQLVINRLTQRVIGWEMARHYANPDTYPAQGMRGPVVVLANQWSGSDGDIIAAVAKIHGLTVVGMRTWGGVIGIDGRYDLVDGTTVTQPRYACWFDGFGWGIENHGIDPDVEVKLTPGDWENEDDAQLDVAIKLALDQLDVHPAATPPKQPSCLRPSRSPAICIPGKYTG